MWFQKSVQMVDESTALPGRTDAVMTVPEQHYVNGQPLTGPWPDGGEVIYVGMGCFWGAERIFWQTSGVHSTFVAYAGGYTPNPTYEEVCSGQTGHTEIVGVVYDPTILCTEQILAVFWEGHDPTQGMRQGNDVGTQYRSAIYTTTDAQLDVAIATRELFQTRLRTAGYAEITTEIAAAGAMYYAEPYHQQYLGKNPNGYCGIGGTGVTCPVGLVS